MDTVKDVKDWKSSTKILVRSSFPTVLTSLVKPKLINKWQTPYDLRPTSWSQLVPLGFSPRSRPCAFCRSFRLFDFPGHSSCRCSQIVVCTNGGKIAHSCFLQKHSTMKELISISKFITEDIWKPQQFDRIYKKRNNNDQKVK